MSAVKNVIKDNYNMMLLKDYLREKIKDAGFENVEVSKTPTGTRVVLHVTRPGIVIGRKGTGIKELTEKLESDYGLKNPQIAVEEITKPELSPEVMCNRMASHLERGTAFRRATMWTIQQIMEGGAMGTEITISGKLRGDRSAFEKHSQGILPRAGHHADVIVAGGMESMTNSPYLIENARSGQRLGHGKLVDSMIHDGLWDVYNDKHMGNCAEMLAAERNFTRHLQDEYAIDSYNKSISAIKNKIFSTEIVPVEVNQRKGKSIFVMDDEEPGRVKFDKITKLRPAFASDGTITAANASKLNDGAAALLVMSEQKANECGLKPLGSILGHASSAHDPEWFTTAPSKVIKKLLNKVSLDSNDIDLWEINEAFSVVSMAAIEDFSINKDKVNIYGGAVALGHPIGASGARIITTLLNGMERTDSQLGLATLCIGGGEASALIIEKND